jgi:hypothetical protein
MRTASALRNAPGLITAIAISVLLAACGGGGDDGGSAAVDVSDEPAPPMPTTVNFNIATKDSARLTFAADGISIAYPLLKFSGTWNRTAQTWRLTGSTGVDSGSMLFGAFSAQVIEPLTWSGDKPPATGKLEFITPAGNSFFPGQTVQTTIDSDPQPILLTYNTESIRYDWDSYLLAWADTMTPSQWRLASFGMTASALVADRGRIVLELMAFINANDLRISAAGAAGLDTACSPRPGAATGTRKIALANPDGELNPGDGLIVTYTNCWLDEPTNDIDLLYNGSITLSGYIENKTPFSTGFDEFRFNSLAENETTTVAGVVTVVQPPVVTTGTMTLFVTP